MDKNLEVIIKAIPKFKFKNDSFMRSRGAPAMLVITCAQCNSYLMSYQKDGPGPLLRCYLDRIHHPEILAERQNQEFDKKTAPKLECPSCHIVVGSPIIYEKETRPAYHLRPGFIKLKKIY